MLKVENIGKTDNFVYDISLDGTVVNALGLNIASNTDGFNFQLPETYRYTDENPYISNGASRETEKGKAYVGLKGDVAEFNDLYMKDFHYEDFAVNKMGLGIDEVVSSTINFSRKNYADYFANEEYPNDVKMVGNTIKSKKMPEYIAKFLDKGIRLLLKNKGKEFIEDYYSYIEKIDNYQIPLRQIASKGKIKKTLNAYIKDCAPDEKGKAKSRQAWYELAIKHNLKVNMGETIYYINTGTAPSHSDVKKVTHFVTYDEKGERIDLTTTIEKEAKKFRETNNSKLTVREYVAKYRNDIRIEEDIIMNCELVPTEIVEAEKEFYCEDGKEYNAPKYIKQFNNRIKPLLVCFKPEIRDRILITNPDERPFFTEEECKLCSGFPNKVGDQDTYEELMTMSDNEIRFWLDHPEWDIPYLDACEMDWNKIRSEYFSRIEKENQLGIDKIKEAFNDIIKKLSAADYEKLIEGTLPSSLDKIVKLNSDGKFVAKDYPDMHIGSMSDIFDLLESKINQVEEEMPW